jgi:hypothetical protein
MKRVGVPVADKVRVVPVAFVKERLVMVDVERDGLKLKVQVPEEEAILMLVVPVYVELLEMLLPALERTPRKVRALSLELKVVQSAADKNPPLEAEEVAKLNVWTPLFVVMVVPDAPEAANV